MNKLMRLWWWPVLLVVAAWVLLVGLLLRPHAFLLLAAADWLVGRKPYGGWYGLKCDCFNDLIDDYDEIKSSLAALRRGKP